MERKMIPALRIAIGIVLTCGLTTTCCLGQEQGTEQGAAIQEIQATLNRIDPYLPSGEVSAEVDVFGSTSMDTMAHGWATDFKKFHEKAKVVISAEGSETVFKRLAANPTAVGMLSRPVTEEELEELKRGGLKNPVAIMVAREPLGVFVNEANPLNEISFEQLVSVFCKGTATDDEMTWQAMGVSGELAGKRIQLFERDSKSGTHAFVKNYLFKGLELKSASSSLSSNAAVAKAVGESPEAIAICGLKCGGHDAKALHLKGATTLFPDDDHAILVGGYPLVRPLTLVLDLGQDSERSIAAREFVRFALSQAGQMQTILCGFFPFDPPTLRAESLKLGETSTEDH